MLIRMIPVITGAAGVMQVLLVDCEVSIKIHDDVLDYEDGRRSCESVLVLEEQEPEPQSYLSMPATSCGVNFSHDVLRCALGAGSQRLSHTMDCNDHKTPWIGLLVRRVTDETAGVSIVPVPPKGRTNGAPKDLH